MKSTRDYLILLGTTFDMTGKPIVSEDGRIGCTMSSSSKDGVPRTGKGLFEMLAYIGKTRAACTEVELAVGEVLGLDVAHLPPLVLTDPEITLIKSRRGTAITGCSHHDRTVDGVKYHYYWVMGRQPSDAEVVEMGDPDPLKAAARYLQLFHKYGVLQPESRGFGQPRRLREEVANEAATPAAITPAAADSQVGEDRPPAPIWHFETYTSMVEGGVEYGYVFKAYGSDDSLADLKLGFISGMPDSEAHDTIQAAFAEHRKAAMAFVAEKNASKGS